MLVMLGLGGPDVGLGPDMRGPAADAHDAWSWRA